MPSTSFLVESFIKQGIQVARFRFGEWQVCGHAAQRLRSIPFIPSAGPGPSHVGDRAHLLRGRAAVRPLRVALCVSVDAEKDSR